MRKGEVPRYIDLPKAEYKFKDFGIFIEHNYFCAVCRDESAVLDMRSGILQPCWGCQKLGFKVVKLSKFKKLFFKD